MFEIWTSKIWKCRSLERLRRSQNKVQRAWNLSLSIRLRAGINRKGDAQRIAALGLTQTSKRSLASIFEGLLGVDVFIFEERISYAVRLFSSLIRKQKNQFREASTIGSEAIALTLCGAEPHSSSINSTVDDSVETVSAINSTVDNSERRLAQRSWPWMLNRCVGCCGGYVVSTP